MKFAYRAVDGRGHSCSGRLEAQNSDQALAQLAARGLTVWELAADSLPRLKVHPRLFQQLALLLSSGVPLVRSLEGMQHPVASYLAGALARGLRLSAAMRRLPELFRPDWVQVVAVGEESGALVLVLERLSLHLEREEARRRRFMAALVYPLFTFTGALLTLAALVFVMVPRFVALALTPGQPLPGPTRLLLAFSRPEVLLALVWVLGLAALALYLSRNDLGRLATRFRIVQDALTASFCRHLALMLEAGLTLEQSLEVLGRREMLASLRSGQDVADLFAGMPPMVSHLVRVGLHTGRLAPMLERVGRLLEEETEDRLATLLTLLEPLLMGICGLVVGFVVMAAFLPIYRLPLGGM